jgi:quinol monooxygenase YgiN
LTVLCLERFPVDAGRTDDFERAVADMLVALRAAPGAMWADVARTLDGDPSYLLTAEWRTEADADAWNASVTASEFVQGAEALLRGDVTRRRFVSPG